MFATRAQSGGTVDLPRSWLYSNEEHQVLERAAAILAVEVQDLPSLLSVTHSIANDNEHGPLQPLPIAQAYSTNIQPALAVNTSPAACRNVSAVDNGLDGADEELISPFSWHSDSIQSSQWSPEPAYHPVTPERTNDTTVWDGLGATLFTGAMVDAQYAPLYQERFDSMSNTSLDRGAPFGLPGHAMDFSESSYEAGVTGSDPGNPGGSLDSILAEGEVKFNWAGATGMPQASLLGLRQNVNASSIDGQEWLGQLEGPTIVGYGSGCSMTETYHAEENRSQAFADEVPQPLPLQAASLSAERALEELPTQCQKAQINGHGIPIANPTAIQWTQDSSRNSDMALNRSVVPAPANGSRAEPISLQARARYQGAHPVSGRIAKRRKPFRDPQKRAATGETRRRGACARCWFQRVRCLMADDDMEGKCLTCLDLSRPTLANLPCVRYKITDSRLSDKGEHPQYKWSKRWPSWDMTEIDTWRSAEVKVITITQDVLGGSTFDIPCREFIPVEGDSLERIWKKRGITQNYPRAPYAIANMRKTGDAVARFVANNVGPSIKHYINVTNDKLLQSTYSMAYAIVFRSAQFPQNDDVRHLLQEVFQMWVAIRMESQSERICGEETLGMQPQFLDEEVDTFGTNSIPPIMSAQIELITTTRVLIPMKTSILRRLQRLIQANKLRNWFGIYLCLFILLHSCSILTCDENRAAKKYGLETRYVYNAFIEELHASAKTLLYYFHYNNKGSHPFAKDWTSKENTIMAELNGEQADFLVETTHEVMRRKSEFQDIRKSDNFEHDFYFVAQLYDVDWKPSSTI